MQNGKPDEELTNSIERVLREVIETLEDELNAARGRPRILPAMALWAGMLVCIARGFGSQQDMWRLLTQKGLWDFPRFTMKDDGVYKRLKQASGETYHKIFDAVTQFLTARRQPDREGSQVLAPFAAGVYALDEMTLDSVKKRMPRLREIVGAVLPGNMTTLFDVRAQLWKHLEFQADVNQNEKVAARDMLAHVPPHSLILADMGYFAFAWFDELTHKGYHWISRLRAKTTYTVLHVLYQGENILDAIVMLGAYRADRAAHAVRLVSFTHNGKKWTYITNVVDPHLLSIRDISVVYARRWDIEMMFNMLKTYLNLHVLWSSHINVVLHQVYAVFTVAQCILGLRADIAQQANADVFEVSLDLLIRWVPRIAHDGQDPVKELVAWGRAAKIIRPSSRIKLTTPDPPLSDYIPVPADLVLIRQPRYAGKT